MIRNVIVDTGPLIAFIDRKDQHHEWARSCFGETEPPLLTCEAVFTEACFLARRVSGGVPAVLELFERGVCQLKFNLERHRQEISSMMLKYLDVPMSVADACLVTMTETIPDGCVLTLDGGFRIFRRSGRQKLPLLMF